MKDRIRVAVNILVIICMPFMMYVNISNTKVNVAMADILLLFVAVIFLIDINHFIIQKRWIYVLYFTGLLLSLFLSQYVSRFDDNFLHVANSVMLMEMVKALVLAMYFFTALILVRGEKEFKLSLAAISVSSIPVMIIGLSSYIYYLLGKDFFIDMYQIELPRFFGSFEDPNLCAFYFILIFFISLLNYRVFMNRFVRFSMLGISILSLIVIILTMSRGGWIALAGAVFIFVLFNIRKLTKESALLAVLVVIIILVSIDLDYFFNQGKTAFYMVSRTQDSLITDVDDINRVQLMKAAFSMGNDNFLFGVGKGSFPLNSYKYLSKDNIQYKRQYIPHNTILGIYAQQGIIGILIFASLPSYIIYRMLKNQKKQNQYIIPLFAGLFIHSMTINVENVRFLWYLMGLVLAAESRNINLDFVSSNKVNTKPYMITLVVMFSLVFLSYFDISRKIASNINLYKGNVYNREISGVYPGNYELTFDIYTDDYLHSVEIYDGQRLVKTMEFKSAYGFVEIPMSIEKDINIIFKSHKDGWMKVRNAYIKEANRKIPLYDYILLPRFIEDKLNNQGLLVYLEQPSYKAQFKIGDDKLNVFEIVEGKVIRYSNLSHVFQFGLKSKRRVDINYQLDLLLDHISIHSLLPVENQRNLWSHRLNLSPGTEQWEEGSEYTVSSSRLLTSETFRLFGRYYDYENKIYSQESYFPIQFKQVKEKQEIIALGESQWINVRSSKDKKNIIHMNYNSWVESARMNLEPGDYEITFKAQGSFLEEYSKLRLRNSYLDEIAEITLDGTMKEYTVKYHVDEEQQGISFVLELINYKSEKDMGSREVLLEDWVRVK